MSATPTPEQLLANLQRIAQKMDADMRTVSAFMKLVKQRIDHFDVRLAALESATRADNARSVSPPPPAPKAPERFKDVRGLSEEDAVFASGEGD